MTAPSLTPTHAARLAELKRISSRLSLGMTLLTLTAYFGFILLIAFVPHWLTLPLSDRSHLTTGIVVGIGLYGFCVVATGFYAWQANRHIDPLLREIHQAAGCAEPLKPGG